MSSENIETEESKELNCEILKESLDLTSKLKETSNCETSEVSIPTKKEISAARKLALAKARAARTIKAKERRESYQKLLIETSDEETEYIIKKVRRNTNPNPNQNNNDNNNNTSLKVIESIESARPPSPPPPPPQLKI